MRTVSTLPMQILRMMLAEALSANKEGLPCIPRTGAENRPRPRSSGMQQPFPEIGEALNDRTSRRVHLCRGRRRLGQ